MKYFYSEKSEYLPSERNYNVFVSEQNHIQSELDALDCKVLSRYFNPIKFVIIGAFFLALTALFAAVATAYCLYIEFPVETAAVVILSVIAGTLFALGLTFFLIGLLARTPKKYRGAALRVIYVKQIEKNWFNTREINM